MTPLLAAGRVAPLETGTADGLLLDERERGPRRVKVCEVGPQTQDDIRFIDLLSAAGLPAIELNADVMARIDRHPGTTYACRVHDPREFERARSADVRAIAVFTAASETFARRDLGRSLDESLALVADIARAARAEGMWLRAHVAAAFGCPYEGEVPIDHVVRVANALAELGVDEISLGDTLGVATAQRVTSLSQALQTDMPVERIAMHFHDTHGHALDNIKAALAMNVSIFDSSAREHGGDVATEDVVAMLHACEFETGVSLEGVRAALRPGVAAR